MKQGDITRRPLLGILTVRRPGTETFRGNRANFRDLIQMGQRVGVTVAVFTPESIQSRDSMVCWILTDTMPVEWKRVLLPLPAVVYNRVPDREAEQGPAVRQVKRWLVKQGILLFNPQFFDKRQLCEWLQSAPETARYLPDTVALEREQQIDQMLVRHQLLYVKPVDGKAGDGIMQIRKISQGYRVTAQHKGKRQRVPFATRQQVASAVWRHARGRAYLLQQGVALATFAGRPFDLRLLVQKNRDGLWRVTGVGARVADGDGITTHVPNGGEIARAAQALRLAFGQARGEAILRHARQMALLCAKTIEQQAAGAGALVGEMSMDIGVGQDGSLWFFEANAKPMKFDEPLIRAKSLLRLLQYSAFLAHEK